MATTKLKKNAAGDFVEVADTAAPTELRKSAFRDEQDADVYHLEIVVTDGTVYAREMDDECFAKLLELQTDFRDFAQSAKSDEERASAVEAKQPEEAAKIRAASMKGVQDIRARNAKFTRALVSSQVAGWSFDRPFSPDAFKQLRGDDQTAVIEKIMSASLIGREDSDFLAPTSAQS